MNNEEISSKYRESFKRELRSRTELDEAVRTIRKAGGSYDVGAIDAELNAREVLNDPNNNLGPSEEVGWRDRLRRVEVERRYSPGSSN
jgi:hypothetical protein